MATTTLRRKEAINIIRHKTAFSKQQVESLIISREGGKISYAYFREIIDQLRLRAGRTAFALNNKTEWEYVERRLKETNLPAIKFVEYFCSAPETSAQIRAELMKPKTTTAQVKQFLADCFGKDFVQKVSGIGLGFPRRKYQFCRIIRQDNHWSGKRDDALQEKADKCRSNTHISDIPFQKAPVESCFVHFHPEIRHLLCGDADNEQPVYGAPNCRKN